MKAFVLCYACTSPIRATFGKWYEDEVWIIDKHDCDDKDWVGDEGPILSQESVRLIW